MPAAATEHARCVCLVSNKTKNKNKVSFALCDGVRASRQDWHLLGNSQMPALNSIYLFIFRLVSLFDRVEYFFWASFFFQKICRSCFSSFGVRIKLSFQALKNTAKYTVSQEINKRWFVWCVSWSEVFARISNIRHHFKHAKCDAKCNMFYFRFRISFRWMPINIFGEQTKTVHHCDDGLLDGRNLCWVPMDSANKTIDKIAIAILGIVGFMINLLLATQVRVNAVSITMEWYRSL